MKPSQSRKELHKTLQIESLTFNLQEIRPTCMQELRFNPAVKEKFTSYPEHAREKLLYLRNLIIETATENGVVKLEETLKMGRTKLSDEEGKHHQNGLESKSTQSVRHVF